MLHIEYLSAHFLSVPSSVQENSFLPKSISDCDKLVLTDYTGSVLHFHTHILQVFSPAVNVHLTFIPDQNVILIPYRENSPDYIRKGQQ